MIEFCIVGLVLFYFAWAVRRIYLQKKAGKNRCAGCPYQGTDACHPEIYSEGNQDFP